MQETVRDDGGAVVLVVNVPKGAERPYRTDRGVHYVRTAGGRQQASRQELLRLFRGTRSLFFDEGLLPEGGIGDLDRNAVDSYLASLDPPAEWSPEILANLNFAREGSPTAAGMLLFGREPDRFVAGAYASAARITGTDLAGSVTDQKTIRGPIPVLAEDVRRFLRAHLPVAREAAGFEPEARPELPEAALREAVLNSLAHRDYTIAGPVRILVFDGRVEVRSPGRLPNAVTVDAIRRGAAHVVRNPTAIATLARMGLVTDIGRGVLRIIRQVRDATGLEVALHEEANEFVVALPRPARPARGV